MGSDRGSYRSLCQCDQHVKAVWVYSMVWVMLSCLQSTRAPFFLIETLWFYLGTGVFHNCGINFSYTRLDSFGFSTPLSTPSLSTTHRLICSHINVGCICKLIYGVYLYVKGRYNIVVGSS